MSSFRGQEYQKAVTLEVLGLCRIIFTHVNINSRLPLDRITVYVLRDLDLETDTL